VIAGHMHSISICSSVAGPVLRHAVLYTTTLRAGGKLRGHGNGVSIPEELQKDLSDGMVKSDGFAVCTTEENDVK